MTTERLNSYVSMQMRNIYSKKRLHRISEFQLFSLTCFIFWEKMCCTFVSLIYVARFLS